MATTLARTATLSTRLTSLLYGALMSAVALASVPGLHYTTKGNYEAEPTAEARPVPQPQPQPRVAPRQAGGISQPVLASYLAREWSLGRGYATQVASAMLSSSKRHGVDPFLLMAVAAAESSFQHSVGNPDGGFDPMKPFGIMQVAGQFHPDKFPGGQVKPTSVVENVDIGARVLKEYLVSERGNERRALLRYNGSLHVSDKYFQKVNRFKQRLLRGLRGTPSDEEAS